MICDIRRRRPTTRRPMSDDAGAVTIEFLIAFPPVFLLFLGATQFALIAAAELVVRHAAIEGARAATVVLDDDPRHYGGAPRLQIDGEQDGPRMTAIRAAVHPRLVAIAPGPRLPADYLAIATAIAFPQSAGAAALQQGEVSADQLVLRVTHLVPCIVPIVSAWMCHELAWDSHEQRLHFAGADEGGGRAIEELRQAPAPERQELLARSGVRFAVMQAEAALPLHGAQYLYRSERGDP